MISERWPSADEPPRPASHLAGPDQRAVVAGRDTGDDRLTVPGSLGVLDTAVNRVLALNPVPPTGGTLIVAAADHPITRHGISAFPPSVTADVLAATARGSRSEPRPHARPDCAWKRRTLARRARSAIWSSRTRMRLDDVNRLIEHGQTLGRRLADHGLICLGEVGIGNTTVAAALSCALLGLSPVPPLASAPAPTRRWSSASAMSSPAPSPGRAPTTATTCATPGS